MKTATIDGKLFASMLMGGCVSLSAHAQELNDLNVFPVCDGDTGTNMTRTMEGGLSRLQKENEETIEAASGCFAKGILLSARGNSGVILSQIFAGINEGLKGYEKVSARELAAAFEKGIEKSYCAVQNPTEGTILTVFRESTRYAAEHLRDDSSIEDFYRLHLEEAERSLAKTPDRLPVLKEANVVDSGAAGYLYVAKGMYQALTGEMQAEDLPLMKSEAAAEVDIDSFTRDSVLEFGYCTEFLLRLTTAKVDPDSFDIKPLIAELEAMGGESIVAYKQEDIVKVHVHTFTPGEVLAKMHAYGEFLTVKVENMSVGHSQQGEQAPAKPQKRSKFSVVSVSTGEGISALFKDLGVSTVINGGQTANPSIEEFIDAFKNCNSEYIFVLPNNKNVILAAKGAAELYENAKVLVIETKNVAEGYSAMSVLTPGIMDIMDAQAVKDSAERAAKDVWSIEVTRAVRDAVIEGVQITNGDYMALGEGSALAVESSAEEAVKSALEAYEDMDMAEIITLFAGKSREPQVSADLKEELEELYPDCEVVVYHGEQEVYDYYVAVE
ncbi:MAG: DAK2 domain-containing protein [Ruminococcus sp.]|nr:DAK2 domain-containing protein [Ruminococcus sp.]